MKLVAFGVAAKVVVVLEDQDAHGLSGALAEEVCGRQAANSSADHDQVVHLARVDGLACPLPERVVAKAVCDLKRSSVTSTQADGNRRIVTRTILRFGFCFNAEHR